MPRSLDEVLGLKKTQAKHDLKEGDRVELNEKQVKFYPGRTGTIVGFNEWNLPILKLDHLPNSEFHFHPTQLDGVE